MARRRRRDGNREELDERVVDIRRVAKVIKGGRRFAFRTVVVVGDNRGRIGIGVGKARGVPDSIRKASDRARKSLRKVALADTTIPYKVTGLHGGAQVLLKPAAPGTGVIAGGGVRAVLEAVGVRNILSKSQGSDNLLNVTMATIDALEQLKSPEELAEIRGVPVKHVTPVWMRRGMGGDEAAEKVEAIEAAQAEEEAEAAEAAAEEAEAEAAADEAEEEAEAAADEAEEEAEAAADDTDDADDAAEADVEATTDDTDDAADNEDEE
jgi:small subunit ribosomal protein S5